MVKKLKSPMRGMERRARRILETAVRLAEKGGFSAVRLRDIAAEAGVALGTVYKRFQSKEDILLAILQLELTKIRQVLSERTVEGSTGLSRVQEMMGFVTHWLCDRPHLARATLKALSSGEPELAEKIALFHQEMKHLMIASLRGSMISPQQGAWEDAPPSVQEERFTLYVQHLWFAMLVDWSSSQRSAEAVEEELCVAIEILLRGLGLQKTSERSGTEEAEEPAEDVGIRAARRSSYSLLREGMAKAAWEDREGEEESGMTGESEAFEEGEEAPPASSSLPRDVGER